MVSKHRLRMKRICAAMVVCAMAASLSANFPYKTTDVQAAQTVWKFDFGANGTASGYSAVSASTAYSSSQGYGFADTSLVKNVTAAGSADLSGDVNHDNIINVFDLCQMKKAYTNNSVNMAANPEYDVTGDNEFNEADLRTMQDYLLGRIDAFSANSNRYLAVNASVSGGASETTNAGSSTGTYINLDNQIGSSISWTVSVPEDGNYKLTFHNTNGGTDDRPMRLSLSCSEDTWRISFPTTGGWTTWSDSSVVVPLTKGTQTVTLTSLTADGGPNLDYLQLEKVNTEATAPEVKVPEGAKQVEALDRGLIAMKSGNGMFVSWRYLGTDNNTTSFKLYRDGNLVYTSNQDAPTCYQDNGGSTSSVYTLETVNNGSVTETSGMTASSANNYLDVPLTPPADLTMPDGTTCSYHANDCSPADLDGDGEYEIVIKWDPSNSKDNSQDGYTGNVYLEGVELDGTSLWKIDLGVNIRAGAHYTQFMVYDFDSDGYAEIVCKTGDGTKDAKGNVVGDANADHRTSAGRILSGPEYLTLFDGRNGTILDTIDYEPGRGDSSTWQSVWGDTYGNRMDRFLACVAYLDGTTPSVVMCRGYYTRAVLVAYDVMDKQLIKRWTFDSNDGGTDKNGKPNSDYRGQGAHSIAVADVDQDGFDEIVYGAACIDHDGKGLYSTKLGHGDALHVGDFLPNRPGLEIFMPHEETFGSSLRDAATGEIILRVNGTGDTGRGIAGNFIGNANGAVFTCSSDAVLYDGNGNNVGSWSDITKWGMNSEVWFTGTLERAVMDRNCVDQYGVGRVLTGSGIATNNSTKNNACLTADILGDWREEIIWRADDSSYLRIYSTTYSTDYRIFTLMHDVQYREQVATQNVSYNQPPNPSFYLGTGFALPELPNVYAVPAN